MKGMGISSNNTKLILFQTNPNSNLTKQQQHQQFGIATTLLSSHHHHRLLLVAVVSFFTFASLFTLLHSSPHNRSSSPTTTKPLSFSAHNQISTIPTTTAGAGAFPSLPSYVSDALVHYAAAGASSGTGRMPEPDLLAISAAIRRRAPCNLLVFGLTHETLLWRSLNHGGRTVVLDENEYYISHFEEKHPGAIEAYDVAYTTKVSELQELIQSARAHVRDECRPVQNLLFSDCRLGINDLPNQLYEVAWDVILVDGPRGYSATAPGRMAAIFTAAVMARTAGNGKTDVLVHDYEREAERVCSEEFLCSENLVSANGQLAHYAIYRAGDDNDGEKKMDGFCIDRNGTLPAAT